MRVVGPALGYHWSAAPLALAAIVLLVLGAVLSAPAGTAMIGAGAALAGAAATRIIDLNGERRAEVAQADASRRRDLDETRRLAYMALAARETERYELAATIVNALAHHGSAVDPDLALRHVTTIVNRGPGNTAESEAWLRSRIESLTTELPQPHPRPVSLASVPVPSGRGGRHRCQTSTTVSAGWHRLARSIGLRRLLLHRGELRMNGTGGEAGLSPSSAGERRPA